MIIFALENLRSVHNVGSIFRSADGFGIDKLLLIGTTPTPFDRFGNKRSDFAKVALGAEDTIDWEYFDNSNQVSKTYPHSTIFALELTSDAHDLRDIQKYTTSKIRDCIIFVGSETDGVSHEILSKAEHTFQIKMQGIKESLNVSISTALCMYEIKK